MPIFSAFAQFVALSFLPLLWCAGSDFEGDVRPYSAGWGPRWSHDHVRVLLRNQVFATLFSSPPRRQTRHFANGVPPSPVFQDVDGGEPMCLPPPLNGCASAQFRTSSTGYCRRVILSSTRLHRIYESFPLSLPTLPLCGIKIIEEKLQ